MGGRSSPAVSPFAAGGAWTGCWTVAYGWIAVVKAAAGLAWMAVFVPLLEAAASGIRAETAAEEAASTPRRLADLLAAVPAEFTDARAPWIVVTAALGVSTVVAGFGVLRRSDAARRAATALVALTALAAIGLAAHFVLRAFPAWARWAGQVREILGDLDRQGAEVPGIVHALLTADRTTALAAEAVPLALHVAVAAWLVGRLRGAATRAWCAPPPV